MKIDKFLSNQFAFQQTSTSLESKPRDRKLIAQQASSVNKNNAPTISNEALAKLANEQKNLGKKIAQQALENHHDNKTKSADSDITLYDKIIENIEEKIKDIQKKISALVGKTNKEAQAERKALTMELNALNMNLIRVLAKKLESLA